MRGESMITCNSISKTARSRNVKCQAFADDVETKAQQQVQPQHKQLRNPFQGYSQQPDGLQKFLGDTPKAALLLMAVAGVGASGLLGSFIGAQAPVAQRAVARALGAAVASGAALFGVKKLKEKRESAAVLALYQTLASHPDLASLTAGEIRGVGEKYSVDLAQGRVAEMKAVYDTFVESVIPVEGPLEGDEADKITAFKDALGLAPEDAAAAHMDVGRRFQRLANESSKSQQSEYRKALNKLIYVSGMVFGERQEAFLLPWKRVCGYSNESLIVAKRDQAKALFQNHMNALGEGLPANEEELGRIRQMQERLRLDPKLAEESVREAARAFVENHLEAAIQCLKQRGRVRDLKPLLQEVRTVIDYSLDLEELAEKPGMPQGLGKVTIHGGRLDGGSHSRDLRDVFRTYLEEQMRVKKGVDDDLEDDLTDLQQIMGLGKKEATDIISEATSKAYRSLLREAVSSGRLDQATSKADVLAEMCNSLNFDPDAASALHKQLYRQKIDSLLEKKHLTDADAADLDRQRRLLCIKKADVQQVHRDTCGRIYQSAVEDALNAGHEKFTARDREAVKKAMHSVRLDAGLAKELLSSTVRTAFMGFINRSRNKPNRLEAAKELKALVYFSNMVVTPLLEDINEITNKANEAAQKELADIMVQAKEAAEKEEAAERAAAGEQSEEQEGQEAKAEASAAESTTAAAAAEATTSQGDAVPSTLKKSEAGLKKEAEASTSGKGMGSQKEITLREELDSRDRMDIYRNFLHYCMSGNVVALPMGTSVQVQRDESEFARLANLGDILGLTPMDVNAVHTGLAEQAFRQQVQATTSGGTIMTAEKAKELEEKRVQFGLSEEAAQKIIKGAQNQNVIANMNAAKAQGGLTVQALLDMREQGINIADVTSEELRGNLYTKELLDALTNGRGDFDRERYLVELPEKLEIKERRVRSAVDASAKERKRATLVQGVSYLRQKDVPNVVKNLNNLLSCHKALPSEKPEDWQPREEALDLWSVYITKEQDEGKQAEVARILDIQPQEQEQLRSLVQSGEFKLGTEDQAEGDIF